MAKRSDKLKKAERVKQEPLREAKPVRFITAVLAVWMTVILVVFPAYYHDYYWDIMEAKYVFYWRTALTAVALCLIAGAWYTVSGKTAVRNIRGFLRWFFLGWSKDIPLSCRMLKLFWIFCAIATLTSDFVYESFWGNEGRYSGLFLITLYCVTTALIAKFGRFRLLLLEGFLLSSAWVGFFGITDFFQVDLLGFRGQAAGIQQLSYFMSSMGNVDNYMAYMCMPMAVAAALFGMERRPLPSLWYAALIFLYSLAMFTGQAENIWFSLPAICALLPFYLFRSREGMARYFFFLALMMAGMQIAGFWYLTGDGATLDISDLVKLLAAHKVCLILAVIFLAAGIFAKMRSQVFVRASRENTFLTGTSIAETEPGMARAVRIWGVFCIAAAVLITLVLLWANTAVDPDSLGKLSGYLVFNDHWGTDRGYCWRIGLESYAELPILHKIFGYGPDTYGLLTWSYRSQTIKDLGVYYESAHNEFLQYFVTIGPFGCAAYFAFLVSSIARMLRYVKDNPLLLAIAAAVLAYNVQAFINIGLPIATPVMWLLLSMGHAGVRPDWELALPKRRKKQAGDDAAVSPDAAISSGDAGGEEKE